jgi:urea transport system substrate-binding protein
MLDDFTAHMRTCPLCLKQLAELQRDETRVAPQAAPTTDTPTEYGIDGESAAQSSSDIDFLNDPIEPGDIGSLAHYRIRRLLGRGGMGMVFEAEDTVLCRPVALKVMNPDLLRTANFRQRFLREARAMAAITHDHIVTVYQVAEADSAARPDLKGIPYLAMQLLQGESLEDRLARVGRMSVADALRVGREVADGLQAAHELGLIHRDIKPANIWLELRNDRVKILDFGLARETQSSGGLTSAGMVVGTPAYMAPEQARGHELDARCDLFSLGCVMYRILAGRLPFDGPDTLAILTALAIDPPPPLRDSVADLPPALSGLVDRLLAKNRDNRPASAAQASDAIRAIERELAVGQTWVNRKPADVPPVESGATEMIPAPSGAVQAFFNRGVSRATPALTTAGPTAPVRPVNTPAATRPAPAPVAPVASASAHAPAAPRVPEPPPPTGSGMKWVFVGLMIAVLAGGAGYYIWNHKQGAGGAGAGGPAKLGVLYAPDEQEVADAAQLAADEINKAGGVAGRKVELVTREVRPDPAEFGKAARKMIAEDQVSAILGGGPTACRKNVKTVVETEDHLLIYPFNYEGVEASRNIVATGAVPNQLIVPAVDWARRELKKSRFFIVGTDAVYPQVAGSVAGDAVRKSGAKLENEEYLAPGSSDFGPVIARIKSKKADVVLSLLQGPSATAFVLALRQAGVSAKEVPVLSFGLGEPQVAKSDPAKLAGEYSVACYFPSLERGDNRTFVQKLREKSGRKPVGGPAASAYDAVHLWAKAVAEAGGDQPGPIRQAIRTQTFNGPGGDIRIDRELLSWKPFRLGTIEPSGEIRVKVDEPPLAPVRYPPPRDKKGWDEFVQDLYKGWGDHWERSLR